MDIQIPGSFWRLLSVFLKREGVVFRQIGPEFDFGTRSTEVDIVATTNQWNRIPARMLEFCRMNGLHLLRFDQPSQGSLQFLLGACDMDGGLQCLQVNATSHLFVGSRRCIDAETLFAKAASSGASFSYHLLRSAAHGTLSPSRFELLSELLRRDREQVLQWGLRFWNESQMESAIGHIESSDVASLNAALPLLRREAGRRGDRSFAGFMQKARLGWRRMRYPTGLFVAVLGPDGSGKTSVIEGLTRELEDMMSGPLNIHFRPKFGAPQTPHLKSRHPHSCAPRGLGQSLLKAAYYAYDILISYHLWIRPRLVQNTLVIFDRYFPDLLIDPVRYRYGGPVWAVRLLDRVVPQPDLLFVMDAPASVIQARVQEVSPEETDRQCAAYRDLAKRYDSVRLIDATRNPRHVAHQARTMVVEHLERIASERLHRRSIEPSLRRDATFQTAAAVSH